MLMHFRNGYENIIIFFTQLEKYRTSWIATLIVCLTISSVECFCLYQHLIQLQPYSSHIQTWNSISGHKASLNAPLANHLTISSKRKNLNKKHIIIQKHCKNYVQKQNILRKHISPSQNKSSIHKPSDYNIHSHSQTIIDTSTYTYKYSFSYHRSRKGHKTRM